MSKRFVVRAGMTERHAFEFSPLDLEREKLHAKIIYECVVPDNMALATAIRLYKSGVRVKAKAEDKGKKLKPLAEILRIKRENKRGGLGRITDERLFLEE